MTQYRLQVSTDLWTLPSLFRQGAIQSSFPHVVFQNKAWLRPSLMSREESAERREERGRRNEDGGERNEAVTVVEA